MRGENPKSEIRNPKEGRNPKSEGRDSKLAPKSGLDLAGAPRLSTAARMVRWVLSKTVRQASAMRKHVQKLLNHQRDILSPEAVTALQSAVGNLRSALSVKAEKAALESQMEDLEKAANKWLKPYPHPAWRENVEVLLVALTVAMGIRTFFLQPFKIPTGSMQPTLYGVTSTNLKQDPACKIPTGWERVREWFEGISYIHVVAEADGTLDAVDDPFRILIFNIWQTIVVGGRSYTMWFPPDYGAQKLQDRAGIHLGQSFQKGDDIVKVRAAAGDHLFVDRLTYNFRRPKRGEIIVFETKGIERLPQDQFYIKRMVAMGGERVQIGDDRHLIINGERLDARAPHFQNVYSFNPKQPPRDSQYSGHVNDKVVREYYPDFYGSLSPLFPDQSTVYTVKDNHYMVMGDNTMNSFDSRGWGDFPATNVIGKEFFVYWPITQRFGWGYRR